MNQKNLSKRKFLDQITSLGEFYHVVTEELTSILRKLFQKTEEEGMLQKAFYKARIALIPKPVFS